MPKNYKSPLEGINLELFKRLNPSYNKYGKFYFVSLIYENSLYIHGSDSADMFKHTLFGIGETIDEAETDLINMHNSFDNNKYLQKFLAVIKKENIFEFNIKIETFDKDNTDFHLSLSTTNRTVHINGSDFKDSVDKLYQKYVILK